MRRWQTIGPGVAMVRSLLMMVVLGTVAVAPAAAGGRETALEPEADEALLLDVSVPVFDPGVPARKSRLELAKDGIYPKIREAESRWMAVQLKETLQRAARWGAVRVLPRRASPLDVNVSGRILHSDGRELELEVAATDASGRRWLRRKYKRKADPIAYEAMAEHEFEPREPFQALYDDIARDLYAAYRKLRPAEVRELRTLTSLRFAADIAPDAFGKYVERDKRGRWQVERLPAQSDPMIARVDEVRNRDDMLVDTLDEGYADFGWRMSSSYSEWRRFSYTELEAAAAVKRSAWKRILIGAGTVAGGVLLNTKGGRAGSRSGDIAIIIGTTTVLQGIDRRSQAKIHKQALAELASSFDAEIEPVLIEVDDRQVRLTGDAATQYQEWRQLLREIFTTETGTAIDPNITLGSASTEGDVP